LDGNNCTFEDEAVADVSLVGNTYVGIIGVVTAVASPSGSHGDGVGGGVSVAAGWSTVVCRCSKSLIVPS